MKWTIYEHRNTIIYYCLIVQNMVACLTKQSSKFWWLVQNRDRPKFGGMVQIRDRPNLVVWSKNPSSNFPTPQSFLDPLRCTVPPRHAYLEELCISQSSVLVINIATSSPLLHWVTESSLQSPVVHCSPHSNFPSLEIQSTTFHTFVVTVLHIICVCSNPAVIVLN